MVLVKFKGDVSPNNNVDWVSRKQFKGTNYAKFCMSPSLYRTMPEYVISQENNPPLTLYIEFHNCYFFLDKNNSLVDQVQS